MKLFEHPDFEQAIIRAAEYFHSSGMREAVIEKDYYVTEALRIIQQTAGDIRNRVLLEVGTASGTEPTECIKLQSYVGKFLNETGISLGAKDEGSFEMRLLHFRRTFVEKLFAIHSKVEKFKQTGIGIGGYARHYYDLYCLAERQEILAMLLSNEYEAIKVDYDRVSRKHFEADYVAPQDMNFAKSDAIFPKGTVEMALAAEFEKQCRILCFGEFPTWGQVQKRLMSLQHLL